MNSDKETIETEGLDFFWMHSNLLASVDITEFETAEAYSSIDLTRVKYIMYIHSLDEKVKVTLRTRPNNLTQ
jgi:hypothetical protein